MAKTKEPTFEEQLAMLEEVVDTLEKGELPLEQSLEAYKKGNALVKSLRSQLEGAQKQLKILSSDENGENENA